jgi:hypothetical protein
VEEVHIVRIAYVPVFSLGEIDLVLFGGDGFKAISANGLVGSISKAMKVATSEHTHEGLLRCCSYCHLPRGREVAS